MGQATVTPPYRPAVINIFGKGGSEDQTAEVQAALDKVSALDYSYSTSPPLGRQPEIVIYGMCGISAGLTMTTTSGCRIRGATPYAGFRATAAGTYDMLTIGNGLIASGGSGFVTVEGLTFTSSAQKTGGAGIKVYTASAVRVRDCFIVRQYDGLRVERGCQQNKFEGNTILTFSRYGIYCGVTGADSGTNGYGTEQHFLDNYLYSGDPASLTTGNIGILHEGGDACHYRGNHVVACGIGMKVVPGWTPNPEVSHCELFGNVISDNATDCVIFDGSTYAFGKWTITDNHLVYSLTSGYGLKLIGANLKDINVRGNFIVANASGGIYLGSGPRDVLIDGNTIGHNGTAGIITQSAAQDFRITNNRLSNNTPGSGSTQAHGISWGGSHENYIYAHNDLRGNGTAATTGTAGGSNKIDTPNLS